jgi:hypothetical protein
MAQEDTPVSSDQLAAFMEKWAAYEPFKVPTDPKEEPLILAAMEKDPKGPWAQYIAMKYAQTRYEARELDDDARAKLYGESLRYLKPAHKIMVKAAAADPDEEILKFWPDQLQLFISQASLEAGLEDAEPVSEAADTQSWDYGNKVFHNNILLGRKALRKGNIEDAKKYLLAAGRTPGSPQLKSFGPDFVLARELAEKGEIDCVIEFLDLVAVFWANPDAQTSDLGKRNAKDHQVLLESWKQELRAGKIPDHHKWK